MKHRTETAAVTPLIASKNPFAGDDHPARARLYTTGQRALTVQADRYTEYLLAFPIAALVVTSTLALVSYYTGASSITTNAALASCASLLMVFVTLALHDRIRTRFQRYASTPERIWSAGLHILNGAGTLPAALLCTTVAHERDSFATYLAPFHLTAGDIEVITTLIADGYASCVDDLVSLTIALR